MDGFILKYKVLPQKFNLFLGFIIILNLFAGNLYSQENNKYILKSINFNGYQAFTQSELENVIVSKESPSGFVQFINSFSPFGAAAVPFDSTLIISDIKSLENFYKVNGYFDVKIDYRYEIDTVNSEVELNYFIREGKPYYYNKYITTGLDSLYQLYDEFSSFDYTLDSAKVFNEKEVLSVLSKTTKFFQNRGYMFFHYDRPNIYVDTTKKNVSVSVKFNPDKRYKISDVLIAINGEGKDQIDNNLINEIVNIKKGSYYSNKDLNYSQVRLYRTNLFSSAFVSPMLPDTANTTVPIQVQTTVGKMNGLIPEIIMNNEDNAFNLGFSLGYSRKNFFGEARKLTLQTSVAAQNILDFLSHPSLADSNIYGYTDSRLIIEQPFLFGRLIQTRFESFLTLQKRRRDYSSTIYGGKLSFNFELSPNVYFSSLIPFISYEHSKTILQDLYLFRLAKTQISNTPGHPVDFDVDSAATDFVNNISAENKNQIVNTSLIGVNLEANKTNSLLFPTSGYKLSLLLANGNLFPRLLSNIGKNSNEIPIYYQFLVTGIFYPNVYSSNVSALGIKIQAGYMHAYSGNRNNISITQRFNSGGSNSIRGWGSRDLGITTGEVPQNLTIAELEQLFLQRVTPGGFLILEGSIETRNRISGKLGSALFVDFGNVWNDFNEIQWNSFAVAAGFGLRYYSTFAPFRIDFGFRMYDPNNRRPITKKRLLKDGTLQIHIGIGEAF